MHSPRVTISHRSRSYAQTSDLWEREICHPAESQGALQIPSSSSLISSPSLLVLVLLMFSLFVQLLFFFCFVVLLFWVKKRVRASPHGPMGRRIDPSWWTYWAIFCYRQCFTTMLQISGMSYHVMYSSLLCVYTLNLCSGLEPVPRGEFTTYLPISLRHSHYDIGAGHLYLRPSHWPCQRQRSRVEVSKTW